MWSTYDHYISVISIMEFGGSMELDSNPKWSNMSTLTCPIILQQILLFFGKLFTYPPLWRPTCPTRLSIHIFLQNLIFTYINEKESFLHALIKTYTFTCYNPRTFYRFLIKPHNLNYINMFNTPPIWRVSMICPRRITLAPTPSYLINSFCVWGTMGWNDF